jgi:phenylpyruvate tautomerase PptA (4-oxalocrotonate tautomerase family)
MPFYTVKHHYPLTTSQKDDLAAAITSIHSTIFTTPKLFVNVGFTDISSERLYVAGKPRNHNHILANVRSGPNRKRSDFTEAGNQIMEAWNKIVGPGLPQVKRAEAEREMSEEGKKDRELRSVIFLGGLEGGSEAGFEIPKAGEDVEWLRSNWEAFNKKAQEGDVDFQEMVQEVEERGLLNGVVNGRH